MRLSNILANLPEIYHATEDLLDTPITIAELENSIRNSKAPATGWFFK